MSQIIISIREARANDIPSLTNLMHELGYPTDLNEMTTRFGNIQNHKDYRTLIAASDNNIAGMIGLTKNYFYERNGIYVRIVALVTSERFRKKGIGTMLMHAAEEWADEIEATVILVNCGNREERKDAHEFYQGHGYSNISSGYFKKI